MEPIVLRRPLMARGRRIGKADCRVVTITSFCAALLGAVIFASYPGPGTSAPGAAGLLANLQDQAATLLGSNPKEARETLLAETVRTDANMPKGLSFEQASATLQKPKSTLSANGLQLAMKSKQGGIMEAGLKSTFQDASDANRGVAKSAGAVTTEKAMLNVDPKFAWLPEEQRPDFEVEGAGSGLFRKRKPVKEVRVEDPDPDWVLGSQHVKDTSVRDWEGGGSEGGLEKAELGTEGAEEKASALRGAEGDAEHRAVMVRTESGALTQRGQLARRKHSGPHNLARQWGADTLDKMVLAREESEENGGGEGFRGESERPWKSAAAAGLSPGPANATLNATGFAASLANALGLAGELLSATADLDTLARMTAEAIKLLTNGTRQAEITSSASGFNQSLGNATGLFETVLSTDTQASAFVEKLAGLGLTRREVEAVWARNGTATSERTGSLGENTSCMGSNCAIARALNTLFPEALKTRTLYIGPEPCPLFQLLNGTALIGLEPVWNASADSHTQSAYARPVQQSCGDSITLQTLPHELRNTVAGTGSTIPFDLVFVSETFEKLDEREARRLIAAVAGVAKGPVIVAVSAVKQGYGRTWGEPEQERGLETYERDTWWVEAFATEGLVEARAKAPLLEEARANLPGGVLLHLVPARGGNITEESAGEVAPLLLPERHSVTKTSSGTTRPEPLNDEPLSVDTLDENAPWTHPETESTERREEDPHTTGGPLFAWWGSGAGTEASRTAEQRSLGQGSQRGVSLRGVVVPDGLGRKSDPGGWLPAAETAGGRQKPALGLASRAREGVPEEGGRLQEALEKEALAAELEPGKDRVDLVTLAGSETESGATSTETAEDRKALNKRMPELFRGTINWGSSAKEVRRDLEDKRRRLRHD
ncbi:hypothetical protein KFL_003250150 [Klebsormidium nitens]|uniref:Uncharacterized protein n=1 Tax=Klebsormidium nitens TaxID=105231 RepID=A0A1Y1IAM6_KLENI|nr:hypothetical protein KFL_003250150 [Klebsormidium nitens]|eukprot:GAQ87012.1 hypothetical protein KFL_003250150 [Klebsormidium nitens]